MKQLSEMISACSYFFIWGGLEHIQFNWVIQGLYTYSFGELYPGRGKGRWFKAEGTEIPPLHGCEFQVLYYVTDYL